MKQPRLRLGEVEALTLRARWVWPDGWEVVRNQRRQFEEWDEGERTRYECLSAEEVVQVLEAEVERLRVALLGPDFES